MSPVHVSEYAEIAPLRGSYTRWGGCVSRTQTDETNHSRSYKVFDMSHTDIPKTSCNPQLEFIPLDEAVPPSGEDDWVAAARYARERRTLCREREWWNREYQENGYTYYIDTDDSGNCAMFWNSNDAPIPVSVLTDAGIRPVGCDVTLESQRRACKAETQRILDARKSGMSDEQRREIDAAFEEGTEVIDVSTGERHTASASGTRCSRSSTAWRAP